MLKSIPLMGGMPGSHAGGPHRPQAVSFGENGTPIRGVLMRRFFVSLSILLSLAPLAYSAATPDPKNMKAVLVTGASTGIGRKITERLAADGYFVYAGARKDGDLQALGAMKNVQALRLDVTKP